MAVLRSVQGLNPGQVFPVEGELITLGRHPDCDIMLESGAVSRQHARIVRVAGNYYVEDLRSRNGTFVNGSAVTDRQMLSDNDELAICDLSFVFQLTPPALDRPSEPSDDATHTTAIMVDDDPLAGGSRIMSKVDVSSGASSLQLEVNAATKLKALIEIGRCFGNSLKLDEVLPSLLDSLFTIFVQADRGFIVLKDLSSGRMIPKAVKYRREEDEATIRISRTILDRVVQTKEAILSADATSDSRFDMAESIVDFHIRSMMCAPLLGANDNALGVIQIDTRDQRSRFNREDLDVLASVACQAARAVENAQLHEAAVREQALARELSVAHEVQRGILPMTGPHIPGYDFYAAYDPARELGGDYYDYVPLPDGRLAIVVADVAGKGVAAALLMAKFSAETRYCLVSEPSPAEAIGRLNRIFCGSSWEDRFITLVVGVLDPKRHEVTLVNAGHMPPLLRRASGEIEEVGETERRLPVGVDEDVQYGQCVVTLNPGETLVFYTDGIPDAHKDDDVFYGKERLCSRLQESPPEAAAMGQAVLEDVRKFVGSRPQADDICLTCFGRSNGN